MKNDVTIKSLLGLSQEEIAMILGISRIQWAMYETGRRDIPVAAKQKLAALLSNTQQAKSVSRESIKIVETEKKNETEWLKQEYKSVLHKQQSLERKISVMENSRVECFAALEVVHFLETEPIDDKDGFGNRLDLAKSIKTRATNTLNKNSSHRLEEMKLKKQSIEMLKNTLEQKIK